MKKLFLFLSLCFLVGLQAAGSHEWLDEMDRLTGQAAIDAQGGAPAQDILDQEVPYAIPQHHAVPQHGEGTPVVVKTNDGTELYLPDVRVFETLNNMVEDIERAPGEDIIQVPLSNDSLNRFSFDVIHDLYFNPNFVLPITHKEWKAKGTTIKDVLLGLNFLAGKDFLKKFYKAWLNHPKNIKKVVQHNPLGRDILGQIGLKSQELLNEDIKNLKISLNANDIATIHNYHNRPKTIGYLKATGQIPAVVDGVLRLAFTENIKVLCRNDFVDIPGIETVVHLDLYHGNITNIAPGAFTGLSRLKKLDLRRNKITRIEPGVFEGIVELIDLNLANNKIARIEPGVFEGLTALQNLDIGSNNGVYIEPGVFKGLTVLTHLSIGDKITCIKPGAFEGLTALEHLFLYGNQISQEQRPVIQAQIPDTHIYW